MDGSKRRIEDCLSDSPGESDIQNSASSKKAKLEANGIANSHGDHDDAGLLSDRDDGTPETQSYDLDCAVENGISTNGIDEANVETQEYDLDREISNGPTTVSHNSKSENISDTFNDSLQPVDETVDQPKAGASVVNTNVNNCKTKCDTSSIIRNSNTNARAFPHSSASELNLTVGPSSSYSHVSTTHDEQNSVIDLTDDGYGRRAPIKVPSIQRDAEDIAALLHIDNINAVYKKVYRHRLLANRVEVVTNNILEEGIDDDSNGSSSASSSKAPKNRNIVHPSEIDFSPGGGGAAAGSNGDDDASAKFMQIYSDLDEVKHALELRHPGLDIDPNFIYAELEANYNDPSRIIVVANLITKNHLRERERAEKRRASSPAAAKHRDSGKRHQGNFVTGFIHVCIQ